MALKLTNVDRAPKVILVTSALPEEGKTTIAVSLAAFAALIRVLGQTGLLLLTWSVLTGVGLALVAAVLVLGGPATGSQAENLGTVGETYAIAEPHLLSYIEQTLRDKEKSGELANLEEQAKSRVVESTRNPKPLAGIRPTRTPRTFYFDPSIKVEQNITDAKGNIIVPAGTRANPLDIVSLSKHLLFFDGSDEQQVERAHGCAPSAKLLLRAPVASGCRSRSGV
jgi:type-F conjugative transfer system protein TraW